MFKTSLVLVALLLGFWFPTKGLAQDSTDDEYRPVVREEIARLSDQEMFGESYDPYSGLMSFLLFDVIEEGVGPPIRIGRTITIGDAQFSARQIGDFGDWRMVLPMMTTLAATDMDPNGRDEWIVDRFNRPDTYNRCSAFKAPPSEGGGPAKAWWYGVSLHDAYGQQEMVLKREPSTPLPAPSSPISGISAFPLLTRSGWSIGCLAGTSNGVSGEGFFAVDPAGTKYWFDHLSFKEHHGFFRNSSETTRESRSRVFALPSKIEDRFGNSISFTYGQYGVTSIVASDGRRVSLNWIQGNTAFEYTYGLISKITVESSDGNPRTYSYFYGSDAASDVEIPRGSLMRITRPDGAEWRFSTSDDAYRPAKYSRSITGCLLDQERTGNAFFQALSPSGLTARYELVNTRHGYSYAPAISCKGNGFFIAKSLHSAHYFGPGLDYVTRYVYGFDRSFSSNCPTPNSCVDYKSTSVVAPDGSVKKIYSVNKYKDVREGLPVRIEYLDSQGMLIRQEDIEYAVGINMGTSFVTGPDFGTTDPAKYQMLIAEKKRSILMEGQVHVRTVVEFDALGRPVTVEATSSGSP